MFLFQFSYNFFFYQLMFHSQEEDQDVLLRNLHHLKEKLDKISSLSELDFMTVLGNYIKN